MNDLATNARYPTGLLEWSGNRVGGVRRLFHSTSGRPSGKVIRTRLLARLSEWARSLGRGDANTPHILLLVGGPGNGKTEAVEYLVSALDDALGAENKLIERARTQFSGAASSRLVSIALGGITTREDIDKLLVVQDASVRGEEVRQGNPPAALVSELERYALQEVGTIYLACVNRGVLDDALVYATETMRHDAVKLIETIIKSVGVHPDAPSCWPLAGFSLVAVWPMDVESLLEGGAPGEEETSAAQQVLDTATDEALWKPSGTCLALDRCPFCISRGLLSLEPNRTSLLRILRWYEIASGKRWSFRDIFSLTAYLLASVPTGVGVTTDDPCTWAMRLHALANQPEGKQESLRLAAPFLLAGAQYQHALFRTWPRNGIRAFRRDLHDLQLDSNPGLMGLYYFLASTRVDSFPETLESQLAGLCEILDPAVADPEMKVAVSAQTTISFRDLDMRFSQSVGEGLRFIRKYRCLSTLELDVLDRLDDADRKLSDINIVNRKPATASRVQLLVRDFACRFARRSVGARSASVRDGLTLSAFQKVIEGDGVLLHDAVRQVESLLNEKDRFVITLNTTFGEPLPPEQRRATLVTDKQKVRARQLPGRDRPSASLRFLGVGSGNVTQYIPLTYELFKSVKELRQGLLPASLPRPVVALIDTTRARLAGTIVRDEELLEGAEIRIGTRREVIVRERTTFVVASRGDDRAT